jgi:hypothetical protein
MMDNALQSMLFSMFLIMGILTMAMVFTYLYINLGVCG